MIYLIAPMADVPTDTAGTFGASLVGSTAPFEQTTILTIPLIILLEITERVNSDLLSYTLYDISYSVNYYRSSNELNPKSLNQFEYIVSGNNYHK